MADKITRKKAILLDEYIESASPKTLKRDFTVLKSKYNDLGEKGNSDVLAATVFTKHVMNAVKMVLYRLNSGAEVYDFELKLVDCPSLNQIMDELKGRGVFGKRAIDEYVRVMEDHGLDKKVRQRI